MLLPLSAADDAVLGDPSVAVRIALTTAHAAATLAAVARIVRDFLASAEEFERITQRCLGYWTIPGTSSPRPGRTEGNDLFTLGQISG